ncbi:MAG: copper amine oxidase N-terminal domain-containing protein [Proteiniphilum sp.]|nr:copper amine oxidase N-terminal domain-containing protein [Proteiniphilum sp.]MDD3908624.1 copper amine oxidase N-terminal domain-containing protein [Proteiniphilum sp.]MDD4415951.1 copper amine oxidase N-terminal domain-containing protein [Proteiniphilum sp.]
MRKSVSIILCSLLICTVFALPALAVPTVALDGQEIFFDVPPVIENDLIMVPIRPIFEAMGATIDWNQETRTAVAVKEEFNVVLPIGSSTPTINGQEIPIEAPIKIVNGRTLAPVRFVSEAFGGTFLAWDSPTQTIYIASAEMNEPYDDIQKKIADKYVQDITGLNHAGWLDKTSIGKELSETEQSDYISALIDIVDQHREIGSKMPVIYFDKDYSKTIILYQDAQGYAVKIVVISEDGPNGRKWAFDSIERK